VRPKPVEVYVVQITTALNFAVSVWSVMGVIFIALGDYRKKRAKLK
jgi:hypothetical protein